MIWEASSFNPKIKNICAFDELLLSTLEKYQVLTALILGDQNQANKIISMLQRDNKLLKNLVAARSGKKVTKKRLEAYIEIIRLLDKNLGMSLRSAVSNYNRKNADNKVSYSATDEFKKNHKQEWLLVGELIKKNQNNDKIIKKIYPQVNQRPF